MTGRMQAERRTFVLVHGAWHGGWCWRRVSDRLESLGHKVLAPTLTGLGERSHLLDEKVNLTTHITDIVDLFSRERLSDVVLCGHSYGGYVVSGAVERIGPAVSSIVLLDAFLPESGDCILEKGNPRIAETIRAAVDSKQVSMPPPPAAFFEVNGADRAWVDAMCTPHPLGCFTEKLALTGARERVAKKTYIRAKGYAQVVFDAAEEKLRREPTWRVLSVQSGHDAMIDAPDRLAEMLLEAA